jgi:hypothetical protein
MKQKDNCQSVKKYLKNPLKIKNKLQAYGIRKKKNWKKQINEISEHTLPTIFTKNKGRMGKSNFTSSDRIFEA